MRRIYYGETAVGKTRECEKLAALYRSKEFKVISNAPSIGGNKVKDFNKAKQLCEDEILAKFYNGESLEEYPAYVYPNLTVSKIQKFLEYMVCKGDVLILDDIDAQIPYLVLQDMMRCLSEAGYLAKSWQHVIVTGYSWFLRYLLADPDENIFFVNSDNQIIKINDHKELVKKYQSIVKYVYDR